LIELIGPATNVLVRLLTGDDAAQRSAANAFTSRNCSADNPNSLTRARTDNSVQRLHVTFEDGGRATFGARRMERIASASLLIGPGSREPCAAA
jgi:hypothetical protein